MWRTLVFHILVIVSLCVIGGTGMLSGLRTAQGVCYEMQNCITYNHSCDENNCDQPSCGWEYVGHLNQTDQITVVIGGWKNWWHGPTKEECYRSRTCRHYGAPCPEDPERLVCSSRPDAAWYIHETWSNNIMSEPCD